MRQLIALSALALSALAAALALAGAASAGGWATVAVDPLPTGVAEGETWQTEITVLQHGVTPLDRLAPVLTIREEGDGVSRDFIASPTAKSGVYEARVVFPASGQWNVVVESGWGEARLTFGPVTIEDGPAVGASPDPFPVVPLAAGALFLTLLAAATLSVRRRWRPTAVGS
jgi:hypothetical protein